MISIITVCLNSEKTIEKTIKSVINQSCKDFEYIIVDGGSIDKTLEIVDRYNLQSDIPFLIISEKDNGIYDAMNKGISIAHGDVIGIINSDDWYDYDAVSIIKKQIEKYGSKDIVFYGKEAVVEGTEVTKINSKSHNDLPKAMFPHEAAFVSKNIYEEQLYDLGYRLCSDYDFMLKAFHNNKKFIFVDEIIDYFTPNGASSSYYASVERLNIRKKYHDINSFEYITFYVWKQFMYKIELMKKRKVNALIGARQL